LLFPYGYSGRGEKLTTHLYQMPKLRIRGAIPPPLHVFKACQDRLFYQKRTFLHPHGDASGTYTLLITDFGNGTLSKGFSRINSIVQTQVLRIKFTDMFNDPYINFTFESVGWIQLTNVM
jgi:hypothetical protein